MRILMYARTQKIISWAIEWLHYYEIWLITGEWRGGGIEHGNSKK